jgi:hypothetical protein
VTSTLPQKATDPGEPPGPWNRWSGIATVLGTVIGGLGLVVALLAWLLPPSAPDTPSTQATTAATRSHGSPAAASEPAASPVFLDFAPEAGGDRLTGAPRQIRGKDGYVGHPLAIHCPTNQTGDQSADVTFPLHGRYVQFDATVHPYYPDGVDQQSVTYVSVLIDTRGVDNTLTTNEVTAQTHATPAAPKPVSAAVDRAEKLTIRVRCEDPSGTIILTDPRLAPE